MSSFLRAERDKRFAEQLQDNEADINLNESQNMISRPEQTKEKYRQVSGSQSDKTLSKCNPFMH